MYEVLRAFKIGLAQKHHLGEVNKFISTCIVLVFVLALLKKTFLDEVNSLKSIVWSAFKIGLAQKHHFGEVNKFISKLPSCRFRTGHI